MKLLPDPKNEKKRQQWLDAVKFRVQQVDPHKGRCLIQNFPSNRAIEYCHVVPRENWEDDALVTSLEWHWQLRENTLNIDTRWNIFAVAVDFRHMFDDGRYTLAPAPHIVEEYHRSLVGRMATRDKFPDVKPNDSGNFEYTFIPLQDMNNIVFIRQDTDIDPPGDGDCSIHRYPFATLPPLVSHIHPKWAIVSAGLQLRGLKDSQAILFEMFPILSQILDIYLAWVAPVDREQAKDTPSFYPPYDPENGSDVSEDKDRDGTHQHSDHISPDSKQNKPSKLSRRSVIEHTKTMGKVAWDRDTLMKWSSSFEPLDPDEPPMSAESAVLDDGQEDTVTSITDLRSETSSDKTDQCRAAY